ncbi:mandelate racemase/muconate lactonizing enzyme family protein [Acrocarpospora macrocephala]|uniref:Mandelate racemase n=1 Tax=Acrocarpospora macrocephala TaxID=150177 RepID=A0A5M3WDT0_9ACTN|nr:mandelate racemase/muconate lactonizing enzyme family protein [Acrocarpospora macrocephala]GES07235.1 mandelate racemase [Acrocarpospora macrocephala]
MSDFEIIDVEAHYLKMPSIRERTDSSQDTLLVRISTNAGITGIGEVDSSPLVVKSIIEAPYSHEMVSGLRHLLVGENPLEISRLWDKMLRGTIYYGRGGAVIHAMAGVDLALWDLKGKILQRPVYELLGGGYSTEHRVYASHMFSFTPKENAERAAAAADAGYTAMKFGWEPMGPDPDLDEALVAAIRKGAGTADIMVDAGLAWDAKTALSRARRFEQYQPFWLEEPLMPGDLRGYALLSDATDMRIAAGEQECTAEGYLRLMDQGRVDVVQIDVTRTGLTEAVRIARLAADRGLPVCNHNFTTDINTAASLHLLASIPNALMLEYCVEETDLSKSLVRNPPRIEGGTAYVPAEPGLGVELDDATIEKYLVTI